MESVQLADNFQTLIDAINKAKPAALKGQYLKTVTLTSTMPPGNSFPLRSGRELLDSCPQEPVVFEQEFFPEDMLIGENLPYTVEQSPEDPTIFVVEGPKIEKMLGYTNLDSEKGFAFFQKFLKEGGILEELEKAGIQEGDTVRMYGFDFDYYK